MSELENLAQAELIASRTLFLNAAAKMVKSVPILAAKQLGMSVDECLKLHELPEETLYQSIVNGQIRICLSAMEA